jgi:hypothetical protein
MPKTIPTKCGPGNILKAAKNRKKDRKKKQLEMCCSAGKEISVGVETLHGWSPEQDFEKRKEAIRKLTKEHGCERVMNDLQLAAVEGDPGSKLRTIGLADARWTKLQPECRKQR